MNSDPFVRYNDRAVNQNFSLSTVFANLQDPELHFLIHVPRKTQDIFRKMLITIVLKLDMHEHFKETVFLGIFSPVFMGGGQNRNRMFEVLPATTWC